MNQNLKNSKRFLDLSENSLSLFEAALTTSTLKNSTPPEPFTARNTWHMISEMLDKFPVPTNLNSPRLKRQFPSVDNHVYVISHLPHNQTEINAFFGRAVSMEDNFDIGYGDLKNLFKVASLLKECVKRNTVVSWIDCSKNLNSCHVFDAMFSNVFKCIGGNLMTHSFFHTEHLMNVTLNMTEAGFQLQKWNNLQFHQTLSICHPSKPQLICKDVPLIV